MRVDEDRKSARKKAVIIGSAIIAVFTITYLVLISWGTKLGYIKFSNFANKTINSATLPSLATLPTTSPTK